MGTIKTLTDRGFGFISRPGEQRDLFFHSKELKGVAFEELKVGDKVSFNVTQGAKGPAATEVSRANGNGAENEGEAVGAGRANKSKTT